MSKPPKSYLVRVARSMARTGISFREAIVDEAVVLTMDEARTQERTDLFQALLRAATNEFAQEVGNDPNLDKAALIGRCMIQSDRLAESGQHKEAIEGILKAAKIMGLVGAETTVTMVGNLTAAELNKVREQFAKKSESKSDEKLPN